MTFEHYYSDEVEAEYEQQLFPVRCQSCGVETTASEKELSEAGWLLDRIEVCPVQDAAHINFRGAYTRGRTEAVIEAGDGLYEALGLK